MVSQRCAQDCGGVPRAGINGGNRGNGANGGKEGTGNSHLASASPRAAPSPCRGQASDEMPTRILAAPGGKSSPPLRDVRSTSLAGGCSLSPSTSCRIPRQISGGWAGGLAVGSSSQAAKAADETHHEGKRGTGEAGRPGRQPESSCRWTPAARTPRPLQRVAAPQQRRPPHHLATRQGRACRKTWTSLSS